VTLLGPSDPSPVLCFNRLGNSRFVFVSEHAGNRVPGKLQDLGMSKLDLADHIAWDMHIQDVGKRLSALLDAPYFCQAYSRLVIDCNRPPGAAQSILEVSDNRRVPGNEGLSAADVIARQDEIFHPFHRAIADLLDERFARRQNTILITLHSFTPAMESGGDDRPWQITFQYGRCPDLSKSLIENMARDKDVIVGDNVPYPVADDTHYGIPVHGEKRGLPHTMIELRQDCIADEAGRILWTQKIASQLGEILEKV